eukprot:sb/3460540/
MLGAYRLYLVVGIVSQFTYPMLAQVSLVGLILLQALRGFMTGIMVAYMYTFEFQSRWIPAKLRRTFISLNGAICYIGNGTGGLLVEFFSRDLGWEYYFYFSGILFIILLILSLIFMADKPENSWFVRSLSGGKDMKKEVKVAVEQEIVEGNGEKYIEEEEKKYIEKEEKKDNEEKASPSTTPTSVSVRDILSRGYLYSFCIYYFSHSLIWYNTLSTSPFYLHNILGAGTKPIAVLETSLSFVMAGSSILLSWIFQTLDKHLSWLTCRLTFIYIPMVIQLVVFIGFPYFATFTGASFLLVLSTVASSSMFSGSLNTVNVEIDPVNAPIIQALYSGVGQIAGFLGPALMAWLTTGNANGWDWFFHVISASASVSVIGIALDGAPGKGIQVHPEACCWLRGQDLWAGRDGALSLTPNWHRHSFLEYLEDVIIIKAHFGHQSRKLAYATGPFIKGLEGIPRWGGIHNQSYLQFQIRYRNRFDQVKRTSGAKVIGTAEFSTTKLSSTVLSSGSSEAKRARGIRFNPLVAVWRGGANEGIVAHSKAERRILNFTWQFFVCECVLLNVATVQPLGNISRETHTRQRRYGEKRKQPFVPLDLPDNLKPDEEVFMNPLTKEIFRNYEDYFRRSILCNSLLWSCEYTGRANLTLAEALKSETEAAEHLDKMPLALQQAICFIIHKGQVSSLTSFVNEVLSFYRERFLPGEEVEISEAAGGKGSSCTGVIQDVILDKGAAYHQPNKIEYRCVVVDTGEIIQAAGNQVSRRKHQLTRERVKLLVKCSAKKVTTEPALYVVKVSSLTSFVNEVLSFYRERFLPGEEVEISEAAGGKGSSCTGVIQDVILDKGAAYHQPNKIEYRCVVVDTGEIIQAAGNQVSRRKHQLTRERVKLLVKCSAKKVTTEPALYVVKLGPLRVGCVLASLSWLRSNPSKARAGKGLLRYQLIRDRRQDNGFVRGNRLAAVVYQGDVSEQLDPSYTLSCVDIIHLQWAMGRFGKGVRTLSLSLSLPLSLHNIDSWPSPLQEHIERLKLDENYTVPYIGDYGKANPNSAKRSGGRGDVVRKMDVVKNEPMLWRERGRERERERERRMREGLCWVSGNIYLLLNTTKSERELQRKMQLAEQAFLKEWMRPREDLELTDSKELPDMKPPQTVLDNSLYGNLIQVTEFLWLFGEHVNFSEEFPQGIPTIGELDKSLGEQKRGGLFGQLVIFLLKLVFALQDEEEEEEKKYAEKYNFTYIEPALNESLTQMEPLVTWEDTVPRTSDRSLWAGPASAFYFTRHYLGVPLSELQLDDMTVTEILRLFILGVGGRSGGTQYSGKWRFNHRGMYSDMDSPCLEMRQKEEGLLKLLRVSNIFDLAASSKLTILTTLINEVLSFAQFLAILKYEPGSIGKIRFFSFQRNQDQVFILSGTRDMIEIATHLLLGVLLTPLACLAPTGGRTALLLEFRGLLLRGGGCVGVPLSELQLDDMTVTEILRLFILGVGGRSGGTQYSGKWRFNHRGMYSDMDSPCLEMRQKEEGLLKLLRVSNIFDLPASSKLTILTTLINEVLSFAQFREIIEEALDSGREAWRDWKSFGQEVQRKEREEAAQKFPYPVLTYLTPHTKLTDFNTPDGSQVEDTKDEGRDQDEKEANEAQDHTLYVAFKELCHKVKTRPLGTDRYFRRYWSFFSTPGIFVERSSVDIEQLYQRTVDCPPTPPLQTTHNPDIDEFVQNKLKEATEKHGPTPETYEQLLQTPGFGFLSDREGPSWCHLSSEDDIRALVSSLNPRGERESTLIENIAGDIGRIIARITEEEEAEEVRTREKSGDEVAKILETATSEKLMEATVREDLCDLENRIVEAGFGHGVPDRLVWRSCLEDFTLTQEEGDEIQIQTSPDTIAQLREALLQIQESLPIKYLAPPLASSGKDVSGKLEGWREVTSKCSSLSQLVIHLYTLDGCITWKKSALRACCRVCRRKCDPEKLLLCDSCDRGQHLYCMKPKLKSIPAGEWHCAVCRPPPPPRQKRSKKQRNGWSDEEEGEGEEEEVSNRRSSSRGGGKKMPDSEKLKLGQKILVEMQENENGWPFLYPVDGNEVPEYYRIIPNPMDLSTIERKFRTNRYRKFDTYLEDVELIFLNCVHFNTSKAPAHKAGRLEIWRLCRTWHNLPNLKISSLYLIRNWRYARLK